MSRENSGRDSKKGGPRGRRMKKKFVLSVSIKLIT